MAVDRRKFLIVSTGMAITSLAEPKSSAAPFLSTSKTAAPRLPVLVRAGMTRRPDGTEELAGVQQTVVRSFDSEGRLAAFVVPVGRHKAFNGAPLHLHHEQDEWIHITAGEFFAEVGGKRMRLKPGDSLLMPMNIPHRWSVAESPQAGAIHLYTPAGLMDISWDPSPDDNKPMTIAMQKAEFEKYGMTLLGNPLTPEEIRQTA